VQELAAEKDVMPSQLALAWVLRQGNDIVPIPGTRHISYLEENVRAIDVGLIEDDLARIEEAFPKGATAGDRYSDMSTVDV
jgi:aryl-alcohol dehydrogenase-like predicted oxidoreductase